VERAVAVEQEVPGLHIAVDDTFRVRGVEGVRSLPQPRDGLAGRDRSLAQLLVERTAAEVLHDDERPPAGLSDVEDRDDVRAAREPGRRERFSREPLPHRLVPGVALREHLDRDRTAEGLVRRAVDLPHPAPSDAARAPIALGQQIDVDAHPVSLADRRDWKTLLSAEC
jgi:hypothetical protein